MRIADFALERYFARWEFAARYILCASDVETLALDELLALADDDGKRRWQSLRLGYTEPLGLPALRDQIATLYGAPSGDDVITFAGAEEGIFLSMHALLSSGDHAVVMSPSYQSLHEVARSIGASVTTVPLDTRDWTLDLGRIRDALRPNTRVVVVNFPHSPTGAQLSRDDFNELLALVEGSGARLFSDEVYRFLEFDSEPLPAAADLSPRAISLGVMSKAFGLAGLRIGWIVTRDAAVRQRLAVLKDYTTLCNSAPSEILALIALSASARERILTRACDIVRSNVALLRRFFARNADWCDCVPPRAGSVCFPRFVRGNADTVAAELVEQTGVLICPGSLFGHDPHHFRLGFGRRNMPEALALFEEFGTRRLRA